VWECGGCGERFASKAAADKAACCESPEPRELWPISKIELAKATNASHEAALRKAGWVANVDRPEAFKEGDKVLMSLSNGYEGWRTIKGFYKGGGVRLLTPEGRTLAAGHLAWKKAADIKSESVEEAKAFHQGTVRSWKRGTMLKGNSAWSRLPQGKPSKTIPPAPMPMQSTLGGNSYVDDSGAPVSEMLSQIVAAMLEE
jgi:hypothetical protein